VLSRDLFKQGVAWHASRGTKEAGSAVGLFFSVVVLSITAFYINMKFHILQQKEDVNV
jgi:hypothetical protein